ncbi:MAG: hypothetical protein AAF921_00140 [Cyanobacteria bacterium P01_D01_bin.44]
MLSIIPVVTTRIRAAKSGRLLWLRILQGGYKAPPLQQVVNSAA